jgi:hypothetical protein
MSMNPAESDIMSLTAFLIDASNAKKNKILVENKENGISIYNMSTKERIFVHDIFSDEKQNITGAIIGCYPEEIYLKNNPASCIVDNLKQIVRIETKYQAVETEI